MSRFARTRAPSAHAPRVRARSSRVTRLLVHPALVALFLSPTMASAQSAGARREHAPAGSESDAARRGGDAVRARHAVGDRDPARRDRHASRRGRDALPDGDAAAPDATAPTTSGAPRPSDAPEPRGSGGDGDAAAGARELSPIRPDPMVPLLWAPSRGHECYSRAEGADGVVAADRICDGPRRVPVPEGEALERAERLGLGPRAAADRLRIGDAPPEWLAEIPTPPRDDLLWPVARGLFSRGFGFVRRAEIRHRPHNGVDIVAEDGAHIRAVNDGLVVYADNGVSGYGNFLVILHADGTASFYGHCRAIYAAPGQLVARGQVVAEVGATGRPYVPHLHFEWRRGGDAMDPMRHFVERPDWREVRPNEEAGFEPPPPNSIAPSREE